MAPKSRIRPKKEPTPEPSSDSSSDSSEDAEQEANPQDHPDHEEDGEESASESEAESGEAQYEVKPTSDPSKKRAAKSDASNQGNSKRSKTDEKKLPATPITRVWSEADEINLLNGMVEFKNQKGSEPRNLSELADFLKGKLSMKFAVEQIRTKIRRMKSRFSNAWKKRTNGKDPVFSDPHEVIIYEISKKIWGDELGNVEAKDSSDSEEEDVPKEIDAIEDCGFWAKYPHLRASFESLKADYSLFSRYGGGVASIKERLKLIGDAKAKELNKKWKELLKEEVELHYKKIGLMIEQVKLALD